jgi:hypothetical protein
MIYFAFDLPPPTNILICLAIGWMELTKKQKIGYALACRPCAGQFGGAKIILCLTNHLLSIFCRLFIWWSTGCSSGYCYYLRSSGILWILDVTISRRLLKISCPWLDGVILVDYMMLSCLCFGALLFRWLIYVSTTSDSWHCINHYYVWDLLIKAMCIITMRRPGFYPLFEKKCTTT